MHAIIGGGITGLIIGECFRQRGEKFVILTDRIGGQENLAGFNLGPRILYETEKTREFLKSLNLYQEPRRFNVGYYYNGKEHFEISDELRNQYNLKTRGSMKPVESSMSQGKKEIIGWDIREIDLVETLIERLRENIVITKITSSSLDSLIKDGHKIISTINYNSLKRILGLEVENIDVINSNFLDVILLDEVKMESDYMYFPEVSNLIKRVTKVGRRRIIVETIGEFGEEVRRVISKIFGTIVCFRKVSIPSQLITQKSHESLNGIKLEGRFATLNHNVRMETIVEKYYEVYI